MCTLNSKTVDILICNYFLYFFFVVLCDMYTCSYKQRRLAFGSYFLRVRPFTYLPRHKILFFHLKVFFFVLTLKIFHTIEKMLNTEKVSCFFSCLQRRLIIFFYSNFQGSSLERVPRVPRHPLRFRNGCQAPFLIRNQLG